MATALFAAPSVLRTRPAPATRRAQAAAPARRAASVVVRAQKQIVAASEARPSLQLPAALLTAAAALSSAGAAEAAVSPSLKNLLLSVLAGGTVLAGIAVAIVAVSSFDKVVRR